MYFAFTAVEFMYFVFTSGGVHVLCIYLCGVYVPCIYLGGVHVLCIYFWWSLCTLYLPMWSLCTLQLPRWSSCTLYLPLVEFMYLVFTSGGVYVPCITHMPGESYRRRLAIFLSALFQNPHTRELIKHNHSNRDRRPDWQVFAAAFV